MSSPESELAFQGAVIEAARLLGWLVYHTYDSRRSTAGFPDLVLVHERGAVLFRELKADGGRVTKDQLGWLEALERAGANVRVWRLDGWDEIEAELRSVPA